MQSFIFALLLTGVSGVTVLAFRHPNGYAKLFPYLLACGSLVFVCMTIWHVAVELTWHRINEFIIEDAVTGAESRKPGLGLAYVWVFVWYISLAVFLWVNLKLPPFLQVTDRAEKDAPDGNTN